MQNGVCHAACMCRTPTQSATKQFAGMEATASSIWTSLTGPSCHGVVATLLTNTPQAVDLKGIAHGVVATLLTNTAS